MTEYGGVTLARTKVRRPQVGRGVLPRPRLLNALSAAQGLTVVVAPAGYGKTTLLSAWLATHFDPYAWLTLDSYANDPILFTTYLVEALRTVLPGVAEHTYQAVTGTNLLSVEVISRLLVRDLADIQRSFVLVIDDFHTVHDVAIHRLVTEIIRQAPENLRLVIASRYDPPLPLAKQRASGSLMELRALDLRFTAEEADVYLRECMALDVDSAGVMRLTTQTEGWPAGLYLAGLHMRHTGGSQGGSTEVTGDNRYVMDYLVNEVLSQLPVTVQEFLIKSSILEELCQPLCDAVIDMPAVTTDGQPILEWLEHNGIFVVPADEQGRWYRCHYLFRQMLRVRLERDYSSVDVAAMQLRASAWFEENGYLDEALRHALQASTTEAVRIFADHRHELINRAERHRLERWMQLFPDSVIREEPDLLLSLVWLRAIRQQLQEATRLLDQTEKLLAQSNTERTPYLLGEVAARRSTMFFWQGNFERALEAGELALRQLPPEWWYIRGTARIFLSVSLKCLSESKLAYRILTLHDEPNPDQDYVMLMTGAPVFIRWAEADLSGLGYAAGYLVSRAARFPESELVNSCRYFMGFYHYQRNELTKAEEYLSDAVTFPYANHAAIVVNSAVLMSRIRVLQGRHEDARQIVNSIMDFAHDVHSDLLLAAAQAVSTDLALQLGHLAEAGQWAEQLPGFHPVPYPYPFIPAVEAATVLLAVNTPHSRQKARTLLDEMMAYFTRTGYTSVRIQLLALQALLASQESDHALALGLLEESVTLAEPGWFIRLFADLGPGVKSLMLRLHQQGVSRSFIADILAAFDATADALPTGPSRSTVDPRVLLTYREQEVLQLLAERRTDKQIAETLIISVETVRSHISHLANKLEVHGRRAIVDAAKNLGLVD